MNPLHPMYKLHLSNTQVQMNSSHADSFLINLI